MLDVSIQLEILNLLDTLKRERNLAMLYVASRPPDRPGRPGGRTPRDRS